jgi:hypothetical protein
LFIILLYYLHGKTSLQYKDDYYIDDESWMKWSLRVILRDFTEFNKDTRFVRRRGHNVGKIAETFCEI